MTAAITSRQLAQSALIALFLCIGASLSVALKPTRYMAQERATADYATLIPRQFGDWREDTSVAFPVVNPQQKALLDTLYSQLVSRVYVNGEGRRIMLSLAYGGDQSRDTQVHKPEVCYPAQGFTVLSSEKHLIQTAYGQIPSIRLLTRLGERVEPVTYWIRSGDYVVRGSVEQNLVRLRYGLRGSVPDGLLFRVSEINIDSSGSWALQDTFIRTLMAAMSAPTRNQLVGRCSGGSSVQTSECF